MRNNNEIPLFLIDEFKNNNVVLFIGAGISMNAGLPSWSELLDYLGNSIIPNTEGRHQFYETCNPQEKAQYLYDVSDKITIINKISQLFSGTLDENSDYNIHEKISTLPVDTIITTNWDNLIEDIYKRKEIGLVKIWKDEQMSSVIYGGKILIKLHGTIEDPSSIVFSEEDYNSSFNTRLIHPGTKLATA